MVAMSGDSYLLKVPQPPCQGCQLTRARSTSCGVVLSLVLLVGAVLALAGLAYFFAIELRVIRAHLRDVDAKVTRFNEIEQMRAFENEPRKKYADETSEYSDDDDEEEDEQDATDPYYTDMEEYDIVENKAAASQDTEEPRAPLEPAGLDVNSLVSAVQQPIGRSRREVPVEPRLRLYHTLQTPGPAVAPSDPVDPWRASNPRTAMYAELAPMGFVTPPRPQSTTSAPVTSRRSRVMDGIHKQRRHKKVGPQRQRLQQQVQHEVAQDVSQAQDPERSVEVGHGGYRQGYLQGYRQGYRHQPMRTEHQYPQPARQPQYAWRGPWRGERVTDTFHQ